VYLENETRTIQGLEDHRWEEEIPRGSHWIRREGDSSRMPGGEIDDDDIIDRLGRIFKDMPAYTPCPVPEYSAVRPPNEVSSHTQCRVLIM
jgi:hypothetical protein